MQVSDRGPLTATTPNPQLVNRAHECAELDALVAKVRLGSSAVLVVSGPVGIGKTTLLDYAAEASTDMQVLRVAGVEAEMGLDFAGLHQLLEPVIGRIEDMAETHREALQAAFGRVAGSSAKRFVVAVAVLTLLSTIADQMPVICLVDDADCLDDASAQTLAFAARRLEADNVAVVFASTTPIAFTPWLKGLPGLELDGLSAGDGAQLLTAATGSTLDEQLGARLVGELDGNPLALLELARNLTPDQLSGQAHVPDPLPLSNRLRDALLGSVQRLPAETQRLLVLIAAERTGDRDLLERAAEALALGATEFTSADSVLRRGPQITFRHPLVRKAVYASAGDDARQAAHLALAGAMDPIAEWDRVVWHQAMSSTRPDERVAIEVERAADAATLRGGYQESARFLELAAQLSTSDAVRWRRTIDAAEAWLSAGDADGASALVARVAREDVDELQQARLHRLTSRLDVARGKDSKALNALLALAREFEPLDAQEARGSYLRALMLAMFSGRLGPRDGVLQAAQAGRSAPPVAAADATAADLLLDGFALRFTAGSASAADVLRRAVDLARDSDDNDAVGAAYQAALELWDDEAVHALARRRTELARATGALAVLPAALSQLGAFELLAGRFSDAESWFDEEREIAAATGLAGLVGQGSLGQLALAAWRGDEAKARSLGQSCMRDGAAQGLGAFVGFAHYSMSILELGLGNYPAALSAAEDACTDDMLVTRALPELVEAAVRSRQPTIATEAVEKLRESTVAAGTEWGLGVLARARALVAADRDAEVLYVEAIDHLKRCRATPQLARTLLLYGEWLRRQRRRRAARAPLKSAFEMFDSMGARGFARRAETELATTGVRARRRVPETVLALTPHEWRIATLVSEGSTNAEIGARLFISPRTVEYHLGKIFKKLGVGSRAELAHALVRARLEQDDS